MGPNLALFFQLFSLQPQVHGDYTAEAAAAAAAAASEKIERPAEEIVGLAPEEATA